MDHGQNQGRKNYLKLFNFNYYFSFGNNNKYYRLDHGGRGDRRYY